MLAAYAARLDAEDPLADLEVDERPDPDAPDGWVTVDVKAASLNHHDLFALRGDRAQGRPRADDPRRRTRPGWTPTATRSCCTPSSATPTGARTRRFDPTRTLLSEKHQGTLAERVAVPRRNLVPKPEDCPSPRPPPCHGLADRLPDALHPRALQPGETVLVQGAGGGLATAAIALARGGAAGLDDLARRGQAHRAARSRR